MNIIETIKAEIERHKELFKEACEVGSCYACARRDEANAILEFLSDFESEKQSKPACEDVEEAAKAYADDINSNECLYTYTDFTDAFKAGAKWQKERDDKELSEKIASAYQLGLADKEKMMMKEAVEGRITQDSNTKLIVVSEPIEGFKFGDKGKLLFVKED